MSTPGSSQRRILPGLASLSSGTASALSQTVSSLSQTASSLSRSASSWLSGSDSQLGEIKANGKLPEWKVMCMEAEALSKRGDKEEALMLYHKALRMRPNAHEIKRAIKCLTNSITENLQANRTMKLYSSMKMMAMNKKLELQKKLEAVEGKPLTEMSEEKQAAFHKACVKAMILAKSNVTLMMKEKETPQADTRTEDWRQEAPEFLLESTQTLESRCGTPDSSPQQYALTELKRIQADYEEERYENARYRCCQVIQHITDSPETDSFPEQEKQNILANLYSCKGNAALELGLMENALESHLKDLSLARQYHLLEAKSRSLANVGRVHARAGRFRDAVDVWKDKVELCASAEERAWLFHEMGRCYHELTQYEDGLDYADQAWVNAQDTEDTDMQFRASYLMAQCYEKLESLEEALVEYKKAFDLAFVSDNEDETGRIQEAIQRLSQRLAEQIASARQIQKQTHCHTENEIIPVKPCHETRPTKDSYYLTLLYIMASMPDY